MNHGDLEQRLRERAEQVADACHTSYAESVVLLQKTLVTLSAGGMGLTISLSPRLLSDHDVVWIGLLFLTWFFWSLCAASALNSMRMNIAIARLRYAYASNLQKRIVSAIATGSHDPEGDPPSGDLSTHPNQSEKDSEMDWLLGVAKLETEEANKRATIESKRNWQKWMGIVSCCFFFSGIVCLFFFTGKNLHLAVGN